DVADRLLEKHDYTTETRVEMEAEYMIKDKTPTSNQQTQGTVDIIASASAKEGRETREEIGARVTGITVCPCSQEMMNSRAEEKLTELGLDANEVQDFLQAVPQAGHAQRGHTTLTIETAGRPEVDLEKVIAVAREAMSAKIYNLAKRSDEDAMTHQAHENAKFVEDCVRSLADDVVNKFDHLPDDAIITMVQKNEESIHQHNAQAERVAELATLRDEIKD
ncbi:MAG: GTP cyclohydrolase MptA, partial [Halobacteriaceae archaeon]